MKGAFMRQYGALFLLIFISNCFAMEPQVLPALDRQALMKTAEYQQLVNGTQQEKDQALINAMGGFLIKGSVYSREKLAIALLAGADPNSPKRIPSQNSKNKGFFNAIARNDLDLVKLFFEKKIDINPLRTYATDYDNPWSWCKTTEMAQLLIENGVPIVDRQSNLNAVLQAMIHHNMSIPYIRYLLQKYPPVSQGGPLFNAVDQKIESDIKGGSRKDLIKLLIDYGANPYLGDGGRNSPLEFLLTADWGIEMNRKNRELASWMQQYYHVRKDLIPLLLKNRLNIFLRKAPVEVADMLAQNSVYGKQIFNTPIYLDKEVWKWYGKVPSEYENYKNPNIVLPPLTTIRYELPPLPASEEYYGIG
jgi:hypothetical protein